MPQPYHWHPIAVHFPIALLTAGLAIAVWDLRLSAVWRVEAARWLLWLGTACAWLTLALGLLAERTAPHIPAAWQTQADHELLAWWTCGVFTALSAIVAAARRWPILRGRAAAWLLVLGWLAGFGLLVATASEGGRLVFVYGVGMAPR